MSQKVLVQLLLVDHEHNGRLKIMKEMTTSVAEEILQEHEVVREIVRRLELALEEGEFVGAEPDWGRRLYYELLAFHRHLLRHFELEETGGFMQEVVTLRPQAAEQVERLRQEHDQILKAVDELISNSDLLASGVSTSLMEFHGRFSQLLSLIKRHEAEENELIQRVFYQEEVAVD
jgi:hemerythrin-like domain-containing protein